ncbi:MAG: hypothetical protein H6918_05550 [Sphingomonadaceae bacterium]|nr:hypothetical protein [Sphingomonadaceae bacterium]
MMKRQIMLLAIASQIAFACSNTPADLMGLPEDEAERATLCGRAALAFASAGEQQGLAQTELDRRGALLQQVVDATDFFGVTGLDEAAGRTQLSDLETTLTTGNWLTTLNSCKAAYGLGEAEAVPQLPADAKDKAAACGAVSLVAALDGRSFDDVSAEQVMQDPQAAYFLTLGASAAGGDMAAAQTALNARIVEVVTGGAVGTLKQQCLQDYPRAALGSVVELPGDEGSAIAACAFASGLMSEGDDAAKARADAMQAALDKPEVLAIAARRSWSEAELLRQFVELGTAPDVMTACETRFAS